MALVVETGLGVLGAEAYASVAATDEYWAKRGGNVSWAGATEGAKEGALRLVSEFLDTYYLGGGEAYVFGQGLAYPYEDPGYSPSNMLAVSRVTMQLAPLGLAGPLVAQAPQEQAVLSRSEKIGDLSESTTYAQPTTQPRIVRGVDLSFIDAALSGLSRRGGLVIGTRST